MSGVVARAENSSNPKLCEMYLGQNIPSGVDERVLRSSDEDEINRFFVSRTSLIQNCMVDPRNGILPLLWDFEARAHNFPQVSYANFIEARTSIYPIMIALFRFVRLVEDPAVRHETSSAVEKAIEEKLQQ